MLLSLIFILIYYSNLAIRNRKLLCKNFKIWLKTLCDPRRLTVHRLSNAKQLMQPISFLSNAVPIWGFQLEILAQISGKIAVTCDSTASWKTGNLWSESIYEIFL